MEIKDEACALELNMPKDKVWKGAYYGDMKLPKPRNTEAMNTPHEKVMNYVNHARS